MARIGVFVVVAGLTVLTACSLRASPATTTPDPGELWIVKLRPGADPDAVARDHRATNLGAFDPVPGAYRFRRPASPAGQADPLPADPRVEWAEAARRDTNAPHLSGR